MKKLFVACLVSMMSVSAFAAPAKKQVSQPPAQSFKAQGCGMESPVFREIMLFEHLMESLHLSQSQYEVWDRFVMSAVVPVLPRVEINAKNPVLASLRADLEVRRKSVEYDANYVAATENLLSTFSPEQMYVFEEFLIRNGELRIHMPD